MDAKPAPKRAAPLFAGPEVHIAAKNFGPIESGAIDLRPLNVFVGPSNTGKTYLAVLIYALHRILRGFPRLPMVRRHRYRNLIGRNDDDMAASEAEASRVAAKLISDNNDVRLSDLPRLVRTAIRSYVEKPKNLPDALLAELNDCFDVASTASLIRETVPLNSAKISLAIRERYNDLWGFCAEILESDVGYRGYIEDVNLFSHDMLGRDSVYTHTYDRLRSMAESATRMSVRDMPGARRRRLNYMINDLLENLAYFLLSERSEICYLPAARSGIMQSHRVIASSMMARSTRAGLERFPEPLTFSGMVADFMQRLIRYEELGRGVPFRRHNKIASEMKNIAADLEANTLGGRIETKRPNLGTYPEFVYRAHRSSQDIRMSRASSMVSELAPVILLIRKNIEAGDTLILEEPEAHLHPAAQTEMAVAIARLARAGVRVVVTTHSDWFLQQIGNLIREGELAETEGEAAPPSEAALRPRDVGVWLFEKKQPGGGSTVREIPFDRIDGVQPSDYEDVAARLYNRSAELQDRLEAKRRQRKRT